MVNNMNAGDMGIIGGADGPTFLAMFSVLAPYLIPLICFLVPIAVAVLLRFLAPRFMGEHLSWKTSLASGTIACAGGLGAVCFLWWLALGLGGPAAYPIAYPASICGGTVALLVLMLLCLWYVGLRKSKPSWPGVALDVATSILLLPGFMTLWLLLIRLLQG